MDDPKQINKQVEILLLKYPQLRNPFLRKQAHIYYWRDYEEIGDLMFEVLMDKYPRLTSAETISRAIRKAQEQNPNLRATPEMIKENLEKVEKYREVYREKIIGK